MISFCKDIKINKNWNINFEISKSAKGFKALGFVINRQCFNGDDCKYVFYFGGIFFYFITEFRYKLGIK